MVCGVILAPKWPNFDQFHQKWIFTKISKNWFWVMELCILGTIRGTNWSHRPKFRESSQQKFSIKVVKVVSVRFKDINPVENFINGGNLVKIGRFLWKWSKLGHFGGQNDVICQNFGKVDQFIFPYRFLKIISVRFMDINLVKNVFNGVNLAKIGRFLWKWSKLGDFESWF